MLNVSLAKIDKTSFRSSTPPNYGKIDEFVSRSAQPSADNFLWLREQGVTDVVNFRTMYEPAIDFSEGKVLQGLGMNYHPTPLATRFLTASNEPAVIQKISDVLRIIDRVKQMGGKIHIHCKAGADRTGFFSLMYKTINGLGSLEGNIKEFYEMGHHKDRYPNMAAFARHIAQKLKK